MIANVKYANHNVIVMFYKEQTITYCLNEELQVKTKLENSTPVWLRSEEQINLQNNMMDAINYGADIFGQSPEVR